MIIWIYYLLRHLLDDGKTTSRSKDRKPSLPASILSPHYFQYSVLIDHHDGLKSSSSIGIIPSSLQARISFPKGIRTDKTRRTIHHQNKILHIHTHIHNTLWLLNNIDIGGCYLVAFLIGHLHLIGFCFSEDQRTNIQVARTWQRMENVSKIY